MSEHPVRDYIADLTFDIDDGTMVTDVIVVAKTVRMEDGQVALYMAQTEGVSWLEKVGMLRAAERIECADLIRPDDD